MARRVPVRETEHIKESNSLPEVVMMAIQTVPGVTQRMLPNGHLRLSCRATNRQVECEPAAAAMWIALKQHNGDIDHASAVLSALWETDLEDTRYDMLMLAGSLCSLGLLTEV
ncbi:hypothetical protein [Umezawaea sp. Da 62-37]|uniref:hypothetical protein n=1 Tax=Umezawaea sp. Da 62-37 TaxID=3075927 RepID=UPI0028F70220|nr:hypothetical protein [Umezawaea sp. Da 62-37]WNV85361.1 hypothetical protein RM788_45800 [Umezawaea sp. Da 62-37]